MTEKKIKPAINHKKCKKNKESDNDIKTNSSTDASWRDSLSVRSAR